MVVALCGSDRLIVWERDKVLEKKLTEECVGFQTETRATSGGIIEELVGVFVSRASSQTTLKVFSISKHTLELAEAEFCQPVPKKILISLRENT